MVVTYQQDKKAIYIAATLLGENTKESVGADLYELVIGQLSLSEYK